jgi:hypothetical protein
MQQMKSEVIGDGAIEILVMDWSFRHFHPVDDVVEDWASYLPEKTGLAANILANPIKQFWTITLLNALVLLAILPYASYPIHVLREILRARAKPTGSWQLKPLNGPTVGPWRGFHETMP